MAIEANPQLNLPLGLSKADITFDEKTQAELIEKLANLIFLLWATANNKDNTSEEKINE